MRGYRVLARGGRLLDVNEAIKHGGLNLARLPRLAIARANAESSRWSGDWGHQGGGVYRWARRTNLVDDRVRWVMPAGSFDPTGMPTKELVALSPFIPLMHRPRHHLSNYFLLWEANWHPAPPVDPYLLKPITGSLMEIVAEWDVSPVELAAVRSAMQQ